MAGTLTCRPMRRPELDLALDWAAAEGWNPGRHDADAFWAADPGGFWLADLDGEPVVSIAVVRYTPDYGFLGLHICRPEHRGKGHGYALSQAGMRHLGGRCIGLDGVVAQQANYRTSGFALRRRNIRYGAALPFAEIAAYDRTCFEAPCDAFLRG